MRLFSMALLLLTTASFAQDASSKIHKLLEQLSETKYEIDGIYVQYKDSVIVEAYYNGYEQDQVHDLRSVTKSIRSLLIGIALDKGYIHHIDDPIQKYLGNIAPTRNLDPRKDQITIKHLLTMSAGWDCDDWDPKSKGQEDRVYKKKDWIQYTLNLPMINDPGEKAMYCSMGSVILSKIIEESSGLEIEAFAKKYLFEPLGIEMIEWKHTNRGEVISAAKRLLLNPRDMAKIGQLILQKGQYNGQQIVSEQWIRKATAPQLSISNIPYGYSWWTIPLKSGGQYYDASIATGNGGQYIMVLPSLELIATFTGSAFNKETDKFPFAIMQQIILPTVLE